MTGWRVTLRCMALAMVLVAGRGGAAEIVTAPISYRLPFDGTEKTYLVTLVVALRERPDWIIGHVISGAARTVNTENRGEFTENWDLKDDNFQPVPQDAKYYARGIYAPAEKWKIDGQWHSLIPKFVASPGDSWAPPQEQDHRVPPVFGHLMEPFYRISVAENGLAAFWGGYIENWQNPFLVDMKKPIGIDQVVRSYPSGGFAGGHAIAFDGRDMWMTRFRTIKSTRRGFGVKKDKHQNSITVLGDGEPGLISNLKVATDGARQFLYCADQAMECIHIVDAHTGQILTRVPNVHAVSTQPCRIEKGKKLYVLHKDKESGTWRVIWVPLTDGVPTAKATVQFTIPEAYGSPGDLTQDYSGNFYVVAGQHVYKFSPEGKTLHVYGRKADWVGKFEPDVFMGITSIEAWRSPEGEDLLLISEASSMSRLSEWSGRDGRFVRDWFLCQNAYSGYLIDEAQPEHVYSTSLLGGNLLRWEVDYATGKWKLDARWPLSIGTGLFPTLVNNVHGKYIAFAGGAYRIQRPAYCIYKIDGYVMRPSAGVLGDRQWWRDANGDGKVDDDEFTGPNQGPGGRYWADAVLDDLSYVHVPKRLDFVQRLATTGFDSHGNPMYDGTKWGTLLVDTIMRANRAGERLDPLFGGNEVGREFWDWTKVVGNMRDGFYVGGPFKPDKMPDKSIHGVDTAGKTGRMWKLTYYAPDGDGGFTEKWRVGRDAPWVAQQGEVYAGMHITAPIYGMIGVHDANGLYHVFTDKGMFVDTLMYHNFKYGNPLRGGTYLHSGESWYAKNFLNHRDRKVYICQGRASLNIYEVANWRPGFLKPLEIKTPDGAYEARP